MLGPRRAAPKRVGTIHIVCIQEVCGYGVWHASLHGHSTGSVGTKCE